MFFDIGIDKACDISARFFGTTWFTNKITEFIRYFVGFSKTRWRVFGILTFLLYLVNDFLLFIPFLCLSVAACVFQIAGQYLRLC